MIPPDLRHGHSGFAGDGEKVRYKNLIGIPQYIVGNGSQNTSGDQVINTIYRPVLIWIEAFFDDSDGGWSQGQAKDISSNQSLYRYLFGGNWVNGQSADKIIKVHNSGDTKSYEAAVSAIDEKSFTLTWTSSGAPTEDVRFNYFVITLPL